MAVEEQRFRIRRSIEEKLGVEEAAYLIEGRPPGGWDALITKEYFDLKLEALEERLGRRMADLTSGVDRRLRAQTWITASLLISGIGIAFGIGQAL
jgi:hypothetical protein